MRIAVAQFAATTDTDVNRATLVRLVESAADAGADLVVAPEAAQCDFGEPRMPLAPYAETLDGPFVSTLTSVAANRGVTVIAGMFERSDGDGPRVWNTVVAVSGDGVIGAYRKIHLYDAFGMLESDRILPGAASGLVVVDVAGMRVGIQTCYDIRFPEMSRALVDAGAQVLAVPFAWVVGPMKEDHIVTLARARAIENTVYLAGAGQSPPKYAGRSMVIDPMGVVLAHVDESGGIAVADATAERIEAVRRTVPVLADRRFAVVPR
jgi:deaminated glutathione amidase